jgi:hypothetical protein
MIGFAFPKSFSISSIMLTCTSACGITASKMFALLMRFEMPTPFRSSR